MPVIFNTREYSQPQLQGMDIVDRFVSNETVAHFEKALSQGSETQAHDILAKNPILFEPLLKSVGHHAMWVKNKPEIRPPLTNGKKGHIPDALIAGKGSGVIEWFIVELKSPQEKLFNRKGRFSTIANAGLCQLAEYIIYSNEKQAAIRDALEISDFRGPKGIFVIGNEKETQDEPKFECLKYFWNNNLSNIQIVSYSTLLRNAYKIRENP